MPDMRHPRTAALLAALLALLLPAAAQAVDTPSAKTSPMASARRSSQAASRCGKADCSNSMPAPKASKPNWQAACAAG